MALLELVDAANNLANKPTRLAVANAMLGNATASDRFQRDYLSARFDFLLNPAFGSSVSQPENQSSAPDLYTLWRVARFVSERAAQLRGTTLSLPSVRTG